MANTSGKLLAQGARHARIYDLDANGTPQGIDETTLYAGIQVETVKGFNLNTIEPRKFTHVGQDRPLGIDYLPPTEAMDGEIMAQGDEYSLLAAITGVPNALVGEAVGQYVQTSKAGYEPQVGFMVYQKAIDLDSGLDRWRVFISPRAKLFYLPSPMTDAVMEVKYRVSMGISKKNLWGTGLTLVADGITSAQGLFLMTEGKPELISYIGDGSEDHFALVANENTLAAAKVVVWVNDVLQGPQISGIDYQVNNLNEVEFFSPPAAGARIVIFYEW